MTTITVNGVQLYFELAGRSGEPLVLVHGSWIDHHTWDAVVPLLSQSFQVLTYDRRGHSQSERPTTQGNVHEDAADLAALIEALDLAPAHIAGHSFGGSIALRLAGERPELFRSLIVNEPPLFSLLADDADSQNGLHAFETQMAAVVERLSAGDREGGASQFVDAILGSGIWAELPPEVKQTVIFNAPTFLDEMQDPNMLWVDLERLRSFPHPALLLNGQNGMPLAEAIMEKLAAAIPHVKRRTIAGAGHEPEQECPERYAALVSDFLAQVTHSQHDPSA